jgi:hypothetical protein
VRQKPVANGKSGIIPNGRTGVPPVKSGVSPDFGCGGKSQRIRAVQQMWKRKCFGRDARNDRPEACSTKIKAARNEFRAACLSPQIF